MSRLSRYLFIECGTAFLAALLILMTLILLPQTLHLFDFWAAKESDLYGMAQLVGWTVPKFLAVTLPVALQLGILLGLGRMEQDGELLVLHVSGFSFYQIARPLAILILCVTALSLFCNGVWAPQAQRAMAALRGEMIASVALTVKPGVFNPVLSGVMLHVDRRDPDGTLHQVLIHDERVSSQPTTVFARSGRFVRLPDGRVILALAHGTRQGYRQDQDSVHATGSFRQIDFERYDMVVVEKSATTVAAPVDEARAARSPSDLSWRELVEALDVDPEVRSGVPPSKAALEWHRRWAVSLATLILGLMAVAIGLQPHYRSGRNASVVVAVLLLVIHFAALITGEFLAKRQIVTPAAGFWGPSLFMLGVALYMSWASARGRPLWFVTAGGRLAGWLLRRRGRLDTRIA